MKLDDMGKKLSSSTTNTIDWGKKAALNKIEKVEAQKIYYNTV